MSEGAFCLVLHGHLPWVLHHGRWPHGADWLYEAASETWLPLLEVLDRCADEGITPGWSLGLTPILLEQLAAPGFARGLRHWLEDAGRRAAADAQGLGPPLDRLSDRHAERLAAQRARLDALQGDLVGAFAAHARAGRIEILGSNATHAYQPLLLHDRCARAQVRAGLAASERHLGWRPRGAWLPECGYRPPGPWQPPVVHEEPRERAGVAGLFADEGVGWFVVEDRLIEHATPVARLAGGAVQPVDEPSPERAWGDVLEPHRVAEGGEVTGLTVLGRCGDIARRVWDADHGYPGDGRYLEFHKQHGMRGLRYWRITERGVGLGDKQPYEPAAARAAIADHAADFVGRVRERLAGHEGRWGVLCAPFDAELFGHWWAEGPDFLLEVARHLHREPAVEALPVSTALERAPADKAVALPEGSWGAGGDHHVWLQEATWFYWNAEYRAEDRFVGLWHRADWERDPRLRRLLEEAARQLLLLQASDWPFVVATGGAHDYGTRRVHEHAARFDDLCTGVEDLMAGREPPPETDATLRWCEVADAVFPDLDLGWWR